MGQVSSQYPGFICFTHHNGKHYFALVNNNEVLLRSEGYTSEVARNNGIESVIKNKELGERFSIESAHGVYFTVLKAGNHQEIARSCPYKSNEEAKALFPGTNMPFTLPPSPTVKKAMEDNYLHCKEYQGHPIADKANRVAFFKNDGDLYFAIYKEDGSVKLRSEGFDSVESRDKELAVAIKYINQEDKFTILRNGDMYIKILKDQNGKEVGRSCLEKDVLVTDPPSPPIIPLAPILGAMPIIEKDKEDDYLECKQYLGHAISDKQNKVAFFQHDGQYYFVIYYSDGRVRLRSEGFKNTKDRDSELSAALRYLDVKEQYRIIKKGDYEFRINDYRRYRLARWYVYQQSVEIKI